MCVCVFSLCVQCITPFRSLVLAADTRREMEEWIAALKAANTTTHYYEVRTACMTYLYCPSSSSSSSSLIPSSSSSQSSVLHHLYSMRISSIIHPILILLPLVSVSLVFPNVIFITIPPYSNNHSSLSSSPIFLLHYHYPHHSSPTSARPSISHVYPTRFFPFPMYPH